MDLNPVASPAEAAAKFVASTRLPIRWGVFQLHGFDAGGREHLALTFGDVGNGDPVLTRIHSE